MSKQGLGYFDGLLKRDLRGWAIGEDARTPAQLDVVIDGSVVACITADTFRPDLQAGELRDGFAAFRYEVPKRFLDGDEHEIDIRFAGTTRSIKNAPQIITLQDTVRAKRSWCLQTLVFDHTLCAGFDASLKRTRKLAVFATYHPFASHFAYHRQIMANLAAAGFTVVVVHASDLHRPELADIDGPDCFTILKRNIGYDFGSYAVGILCALDRVEDIDEIILMNDSVLPITRDLHELFARMRAADADVVACTDSYERAYHLQSYLMWFSKRVCQAHALQRFMAEFSFTSSKDEVIDEGEIGLSRTLQADGFRLHALYDYTVVAADWLARCRDVARRIRELPGRGEENPGSFKGKLLDRLDTIIDLVISGTPTNPTHFFWDTLIEDHAFPFLKRELVIMNPCGVPTYFKLADIVSSRIEVRDLVIDMRRKFGGHLVPLSTLAPCPPGPVSAGRLQTALLRTDGLVSLRPRPETAWFTRRPTREDVQPQ